MWKLKAINLPVINSIPVSSPSSSYTPPRPQFCKASFVTVLLSGMSFPIPSTFQRTNSFNKTFVRKSLSSSSKCCA